MGSVRDASRSALALLAIASLAAGCSSAPRDDVAPTTGAQAKIAVLAPLTGEQAATGRGVLAAVEGVVADAAPALRARGIDASVVALDDRGQQSGGQQQVTQVVDDASVVALIGSTSSSVDEGVQPILAAGGLAQVSLGGSEPWLTSTLDGDRRFASYLTGSAQRSDLARSAAAVLGRSARRVVIVEGPRLADAATARLAADEVAARGGRVLATIAPSGAGIVAVDPEAARRAENAIIAAGLQASPTAVLVMGDADLAWRTVDVAADVAPRAVVVVPSDVVGRTPEGPPPTATGPDQRVLAVAPGGPPYTDTPAVIPSPDAPTAEPAEEPFDRRFSAPARDAARAVIEALLRTPAAVLGGGSATGAAATKPPTTTTREAVLQRLQRTTHKSRVGDFRFDALGVATRRPAATFAYADGLWVSVGGLVASGDCTRRCAIGPAPAA